MKILLKEVKLVLLLLLMHYVKANTWIHALYELEPNVRWSPAIWQESMKMLHSLADTIRAYYLELPVAIHF